MPLLYPWFLDTLDIFTFEYFDMERIIDYLMEAYGEWTHQANSKVPLKFSMTNMFSMAKKWMQFICTRLSPTLNAFDVPTYRAVMLYFIL